MIAARILGLGVIGPGLPDWPAARAVLRGEVPWRETPVDLTPPEILSARERRRTSPVVRLALGVAEAARRDSGIAAQDLAVTFASSIGDGGILSAILETLATDEKLVSPTHFHNSVHNAAAGYWGIGQHSQRPTTSLAAGDFTAAAALTKSLMQCATDDGPVLMAAFDCPLPPPMDVARPIAASLGIAMVLAPPDDDRHGPLIRLVGMAQNAPPPPPSALVPMIEGTPAGHLLPLLGVLARQETMTLALPSAPGRSLCLEVTW